MALKKKGMGAQILSETNQSNGKKTYSEKEKTVPPEITTPLSNLQRG